jgi:hypothetical protein
VHGCLSLCREPNLLVRFQEWYPPDLSQIHAHRIIGGFERDLALGAQLLLLDFFQFVRRWLLYFIQRGSLVITD